MGLEGLSLSREHKVATHQCNNLETLDGVCIPELGAPEHSFPFIPLGYGASTFGDPREALQLVLLGFGQAHTLAQAPNPFGLSVWHKTGRDALGINWTSFQGVVKSVGTSGACRDACGAEQTQACLHCLAGTCDACHACHDACGAEQTWACVHCLAIFMRSA